MRIIYRNGELAGVSSSHGKSSNHIIILEKRLNAMNILHAKKKSEKCSLSYADIKKNPAMLNRKKRKPVPRV